MTQEEKMEALALLFDEEVSAITPETKLEDLIFDSVARMSLIALLSEKFDKRIGALEMKSLTSIQDILNLMHE
jgi:acyl carrier protein